MNRFVCGRDHPSADAAAMQAIWDIIINSLSGAIPIDNPLKQGFHTLVEAMYSEKSIGNETFRFAPKTQPKSTFTFSAVMKFIMRQPDVHKVVLCYCPKALTEHIWAITDMLLADRIENDQVVKCLQCFSPPIRKAHKVYSHLSQQSDKPLSKFSDTCSIDPIKGTWVSSVVMLYPVMASVPGGNSGTTSATTGTVSSTHTDDSAPPASSPRGTIPVGSGTETSNPTSNVPNVTVDSNSTGDDTQTHMAAVQDAKPAARTVTSSQTSTSTSAGPNVRPSTDRPTSASSNVRPPSVERHSTSSSSTDDAPNVHQTSGTNLVPPDVAEPPPIPQDSGSTIDVDRESIEVESHDDSPDVTSLFDDPGTGPELPSIPGMSSIVHDDSLDQPFPTGTTVPPPIEEHSAMTHDVFQHDDGSTIDYLYEPSSTSLGQHAAGLPTNNFASLSQTMFENDDSSEEALQAQAPTTAPASIASPEPPATSQSARSRRRTLESVIGNHLHRLAGAFRFGQTASPAAQAPSPANTTFRTQTTPMVTTSSPQRSTLKAPPSNVAPTTIHTVDMTDSTMESPQQRSTSGSPSIASTAATQLADNRSRNLQGTLHHESATIIRDHSLTSSSTNGSSRTSVAHSTSNSGRTSVTPPATDRETSSTSSTSSPRAHADYAHGTMTSTDIQSNPNPSHATNVASTTDTTTAASPAIPEIPMAIQQQRYRTTMQQCFDLPDREAVNLLAPIVHQMFPDASIHEVQEIALEHIQDERAIRAEELEHEQSISRSHSSHIHEETTVHPPTVPFRRYPPPPDGLDGPMPTPVDTRHRRRHAHDDDDADDSAHSHTRDRPDVETVVSDDASAHDDSAHEHSRVAPARPRPAVNRLFPNADVSSLGRAPAIPRHRSRRGSTNPAAARPKRYVPAMDDLEERPPPPAHGSSHDPSGPHGGEPSDPGGDPPSNGPSGSSNSSGDLDGCDWRMHRVDPRNLHEYMVRNVPHGINTLQPWRYPRPETGTMRNFAVRFRAQFATKDSYLRAIQHARLGHAHYTVKSFLYTFPKLPKNASKAQMCEFLHRVCRHGSGFSVYVPPFATMTHANHTGLWYDDLPEHCHTHWDFYDQVLYQALVGSAGNLSETESVRHLLVEFSGYQILWEMAAIAGHPGVSISVMQPTIPRQRNDMSLHEYMQNWSHFLHLEHCRGIAYSDVYFVETWLENLHHSFNDTIKPLIFGLLRDCPRDQAVPIHFAPEQLISYICQRAKSIGIHSLSPLSSPSTFSTSSRRSSSSRPSIRQITSDFVDIRLLDNDIPEDIYASVCSLMASPTTHRTCDVCRATDHMVASCPVLHRIISDPDKTRRLLSAIERGRSSRGGSTNSSPPSRSSTRARTPPINNRSSTIRQLSTPDDEDTDEDATICQLTDDEADDLPASDADTDSDFP